MLLDIIRERKMQRRGSKRVNQWWKKNGGQEHETCGRTGSIFARRNIGDFRYYGDETRIRNRSKPILRRSESKRISRRFYSRRFVANSRNSDRRLSIGFRRNVRFQPAARRRSIQDFPICRRISQRRLSTFPRQVDRQLRLHNQDLSEISI